MIYRCMFETRLRRPAKVIVTTIVIDIPASDEAAAKTQLRALDKKLFAMNYAESAIYLDSVTVAPPDTAEGRGEALGELSAWEYALFVTDANRELFAFLQACPEAEAPVRREAQLLQKNLAD